MRSVLIGKKIISLIKLRWSRKSRDWYMNANFDLTHQLLLLVELHQGRSDISMPLSNLSNMLHFRWSPAYWSDTRIFGGLRASYSRQISKDYGGCARNSKSISCSCVIVAIHTVHCLWRQNTFLILYFKPFLRCLLSNSSITPDNICCWFIFPFQNRSMKIIRCASQTTYTITLPAEWCTFGRIGFSILYRLRSFKHLSKLLPCCCFWSTTNKRGVYF